MTMLSSDTQGALTILTHIMLDKSIMSIACSLPDTVRLWAILHHKVLVHYINTLTKAVSHSYHCQTKSCEVCSNLDIALKELTSIHGTLG